MELCLTCADPDGDEEALGETASMLAQKESLQAELAGILEELLNSRLTLSLTPPLLIL